VPVKPPTIVDLTWTGGLSFSTTTKQSSLTLDSAGVAGPSPVDALAAALAGCMTTDVTDILLKGRHALRGLKSHFVAERAQTEPHRFLTAALHIAIEGDVPSGAIDRAISLSRDKYCSVWHSMRQDIEFTVTFDVAS
jgi:putative redox protein